MAISNFNDILNMPTESLPQPKPWPVGTYEVVVSGHYEKKAMNTKNGEAERIHFPLRALKAMPDVDLTALAEMGGLEEKFPDYTIWLGYNDEEALKNIGRGTKEFVEACGQTFDGVPLKVALESVINARCMVAMKHGEYNGRPVANIARVFKVG